MALQPASGARDLLPRDVGVNRWIAEQLSAVYRRWGYEEVMPTGAGTYEREETHGHVRARDFLLISIEKQEAWRQHQPGTNQ